MYAPGNGRSPPESGTLSIIDIRIQRIHRGEINRIGGLGDKEGDKAHTAGVSVVAIVRRLPPTERSTLHPYPPR